MKRLTHKKLRIGVLGAGAISAVHLKAFSQNPNVTIAALAEPNETLRRERAGTYNIRKTYSDYRYILEDSSINVIDILLPHYLHAPVTVEALRAGKTVICEKPFATTLSDAARIMKASKDSGRHVYLKQYFRFAKLHQEAVKMILEGAIDRPYAVHCVYTTNGKHLFTDPTSWKMTRDLAGGGVFMDIGVHIVDFLMSLFGVPETVSGHFQQTIPVPHNKGEDVAIATMTFPGNVVATIACTAIDDSFGFGWKKTFFGLGGSIIIDDDGKKNMQLTYRNSSSRVVKKEHNWWEQANLRALADILNRIRTGEPPLVPLDEAYAGLSAVRGTYDAAAGHKTLFHTKGRYA